MPLEVTLTAARHEAVSCSKGTNSEINVSGRIKSSATLMSAEKQE
jgi:hypothetical protein